MKNIFTILLLAFTTTTLMAQIHFKFAPYAAQITFDDKNKVLYLQFKEDRQVPESEAAGFINSLFFAKSGNTLYLIRKDDDRLGFTHYRYGIKSQGSILFGKQVIAHCKAGKLFSVNGDLEETVITNENFALAENTALNKALNKIKAQKYKWDNKAEEEHMRIALGQPDFSYYPYGTKVFYEKEGKNLPAWMFNIYAEEPLYRANVFVDANSGKILDEISLLCAIDVTATAATKYSGTQTLTCDQQSPTLYRLRETQRGNGIETFNLNNTSNYTAATDFTNSSTSWTVVNVDQAATDAHWGAEMTYDYFWINHGRNSIDNNGFKLLSYVHYNTNFNNAFWDGQRMTYGDGNGTTFTILTGLDVCGHEVTHGLTSNSSQLVYANESGALNESYSDIFGTTVEEYARPTNWDWKIGVDITPSGNGIRNMQNPKQFNHPNTYLGQYYYTGTNDNGGVHTNSGVSNYWFYLLTAGGTGTNDISNSYTVSGIGMTSASEIAFRALTVYYTSSTNFANARTLSIQAAKDLFGVCSNEVIQTTNAWYAVGVGSAYNPNYVGPEFTANLTEYCSLPANISFNNNTEFGTSYLWDFGDGGTSTGTNVVHSYTANGTYHVKLKATGCNSNQDSITKTSYITINAPVSPVASTVAGACTSGSFNLSVTAPDDIKWYNNASLTTQIGSGTLFTTPTLTSSVTYYVVNTVTNASVFGGILTNIGGGNLNNPSHYLIFDVLQSGTLETVNMYAQAAGNATVQLRSSTNTVLNSHTVNLAAGNNTVTLNFNLTPGTNYRLGLSANTNLNLYRSNTGVSYPYNIASCVSIHGASAGPGFYYWFYNWKIKKDDCVSAATPVTAVIYPWPNVSVSSSSTSICRTGQPITLNGTPSGGTFSGTGVTGNTFDPSVGIGTYTITYNYTDANSCSNSANMVMTVVECTGLNEISIALNSIILTPNPAVHKVRLLNVVKGTQLHITDVAGKSILSSVIHSENQDLDLSELANGVYFVRLSDSQTGSAKVFKIIKE